MLRENLKLIVEDRFRKLQNYIEPAVAPRHDRPVTGGTRSLEPWLKICVCWMALAGCAFGTGSGLSNTPSDGAISKEVEAKLAGDQFGGLSGILVTTEAGVVTLVGKVERAEQKARAADLARQVNGVKRVKNDVDIHPNRSTTEQLPQ